MNSKQIRHSLLLVLTAFIWGIAFVAQREGGDAIGPLSFNGIRSLMGGIVLIPVIWLLDFLKLTKRRPKTKKEWKVTLRGGVLCGIVLCVATNLQQLGLNMGTTAGKAGFLTACYILLVPILGIFLKRKCGLHIWIAVALALVGLYFLCMSEELRIEFSDILVLLCALCFAVQIMIVDHYSPITDGVRLSCIQFLTCGILGTLLMIPTEMKPFSGGFAAWIAPFGSFNVWIPLLYAGIFSCGMAYTFQIVGQEGLNPTVASLLMSLESVFAVLAGAVLLKEYLTGKEFLGCGLMFGAIVLAQLPIGEKRARSYDDN